MNIISSSAPYSNIEKVFETLIDTLPAFKESENYAEIIGGYEKKEERLYYLDIDAFSHHIVGCILEKNELNVEKLFLTVEDIFEKTKSDDVETFLVTGFLESLQNHMINQKLVLETIEKHLKPKTKHYWLETIDFWEKGEAITDA